MKNIAIALNAGKPEQRNAITQLFIDNNWAYWHWVDDFWIVQVPDTYTPKSLYNRLEQISGVELATILVFEFNGDVKYWGRADKDAWSWLSHIGKSG